MSLKIDTMKKLLFLTGFFLIGWALTAQDIAQKDVPSVVLNSFQQQFAKADDVEWEKENGQFVVEFEMGKADHKAWFDATGKLLMHGAAVSKKELPEPVKSAIQREYAAFDLDDVYRIEGNSAATFAAELEKGKDEMTVVYRADGSKI